MIIGIMLVALSANAAERYGLTHVKGINTVGVKAGTGWGDTFDVGLTYQYYFHRQWSFITAVDYERGMFDKSGYQSVRLMPGVEYAVWQPSTWLYLHLTGNVIGSYDIWDNPAMQDRYSGFGTGLALGFNLEFYALPELSFTLGAQQGWEYTWLKDPAGNNLGYNYFFPNFSIGIRYNIR